MKILVNTRPFILRKYKISKFNASDIIESEKNTISIDSKTMDTISVYQALNESYKLILPLGGSNGDIYKNFLNLHNINLGPVKIKDETLDMVYISDEIRSLKIKSSEPRITNEEREEIYYSLTQNLNFSSFLHILNISPSEDQKDIHKNLIRVASKNKLKSALFLSKDNINDFINLRPSIIYIDRQALEKYRGMKIRSNFEINKSCGDLVKSGIEQVIYKRSNQELNLYTKNRNYRTRSKLSGPLNINASLAGYISAASKNYSYDQCLKFAKSSGHVNLDIKTMNKDAGLIKKNLHMIEVESFNVSI